MFCVPGLHAKAGLQCVGALPEAQAGVCDLHYHDRVAEEAVQILPRELCTGRPGRRKKRGNDK